MSDPCTQKFACAPIIEIDSKWATNYLYGVHTVGLRARFCVTAQLRPKRIRQIFGFLQIVYYQ
jgi:hypothetical protein